MRRSTPIALALIALAGCGPDEEQPTLERAGTETEPAVEPGKTTRSGPGLAVDTLRGTGPYLTDAQGRALYLLLEDPQGASTCLETLCIERWPPLMATGGSPGIASDLVRQDLVGTFERQDGGIQVSYAGKPLYYYGDDTGPGTTHGQDVTDEWGHWYLVRPSGGALQGDGSGASGS